MEGKVGLCFFGLYQEQNSISCMSRQLAVVLPTICCCSEILRTQVTSIYAQQAIK